MPVMMDHERHSFALMILHSFLLGETFDFFRVAPMDFVTRFVVQFFITNLLFILLLHVLISTCIPRRAFPVDLALLTKILNVLFFLRSIDGFMLSGKH